MTYLHLIHVTPVLDKGIASQDDVGSTKETGDDSKSQHPRLQLM